MNKMSILFKIAMSYGLIIIMILFLGGLSYHSTDKLVYNAQDVESWLQSSNTVGKLSKDLRAYKETVRLVGTTEEPNHVADISRMLNAVSKDVEADFAEYRGILTTCVYSDEENRKKDLAVLDKEVQLWESYKKSSNALISSFTPNDSTRKDKITTAAKDYDELNSMLQAELENCDKSSAEVIADSEEMGKTIPLTIIVALLVITCVSVISAYITINAIRKSTTELMQVAADMAKGDLRKRMKVYSEDEFGKTAEAFNVMADNMQSTMQMINSAAQQVAAGSRNISDSGNMLANGATTQAASVQELSASITELSEQTARTAENAKEADKLTNSAREMAVSGNHEMGELVDAIGAISDSSKNIAKIIKTIDEIAFQTNILALNAAVEAARAGQHGKGFAVVAEEVGNLAARSAKAAKETQTIIEESLRKIDNGTALVHKTKQALQDITDGVEKASSYVNDIATNSEKQSLAINMLSQGVNQVSQVVQTNSATAEESAAASVELSGQADLLQEAVARFKI